MRVGAVIVNWNGLADTRACLASLRVCGHRDLSLAVVDNGSTDGSGEALGKEPGVLLLQNGENRGFGPAVNQGIEAALADRCEAVLIFNNDAVVDNGFLASLEAELAADPAVGIAGPRILRLDDGRPWFAGGRTDLARGRAHHNLAEGAPDGPVDVDFLTGCAMLVRREVFEKVGRFSERYFMYCEDNDFCLRATRAGFRLRYVPASVVRHKVAASGGGSDTPQGAFLFARNRILLARRFASLSDRFRFPFFYAWEILERLSRSLLRGNLSALAPTLAGTLLGLFASKKEKPNAYSPPAWIRRIQERHKGPKR